MSRSRIIAVAIVVLLAGGGAAYLLTRDNETKTQETSQTNQPASSGTAFNPTPTENLEFAATITTDGAGTATLEHDDKGSTRYVTTASGQQMEFIYTGDAYYSCQGGNCVKYPVSQSTNSGFNPSDYTYDKAKLSTYGNPAYKGKQSCPSGTCDVWEVNSGGYTSKLFVDSGTKRITQVESTINGKTSKIVYEYKDVAINIPANAQTLPTGQ